MIIGKIIELAVTGTVTFLGSALGQGFGSALYECIKADIDYFWIHPENFFKDHPEYTDDGRKTMRNFMARMRICADEAKKEEEQA